MNIARLENSVNLELNGDTIVEWGYCLPDCPHEEIVPACLTEPTFPNWVKDSQGVLYQNFTTSYISGRGTPTIEVK